MASFGVLDAVGKALEKPTVELHARLDRLVDGLQVLSDQQRITNRLLEALVDQGAKANERSRPKGPKVTS